jgi:hypothetical protein
MLRCDADEDDSEDEKNDEGDENNESDSESDDRDDAEKFATSSRRLSSDDITSILTSCYDLIRIKKRDYTNVFKASRM